MKSSTVSFATRVAPRGASRRRVFNGLFASLVHAGVAFSFCAGLGLTAAAAHAQTAPTTHPHGSVHHHGATHRAAAHEAGREASSQATHQVARENPRVGVHARKGGTADVQTARVGRVHGRLSRHHGAVRAVAYAPSHASHLAGQRFGLHETADGMPMLRSSVAYVVDEGTAAPLIDKNSTAVVPIASISKLMTAMVTLDAKLPLTDVLMVTDEDRDYEKGSGSRLSVGSKLSRSDMLHIALQSSENRAAAALSRYYPGGRPAFVAAMNRKALELGMTDTHFGDPTGLDYHNVSSARDLVKMVEAAYRYPLIREYSTTSSYDVDTGRARLHYGSTNGLVRNAAWDIGLQKTGFINEAGECMVMQTNIHSRPVVIVLLDSVGRYSREADAQRVRSWLIETGAIQRLTSADNGHSGT